MPTPPEPTTTYNGGKPLSYHDLGSLAISAGWTGDDVFKAVAISLAESNGIPTKHNTRPPDDSYGLWQINMRGSLGPDRRKRYGIASNNDLYDPVTNARVAFAIYRDRGNKFYDWSTYNDGKYLAFMNVARLGASQARAKPGYEFGPPLVAINQDSALDTFRKIGGAASAIGDFVTKRENWLRLAAVLGGAVLIILAAGLLLSDTVVSAALKRVTKVKDVVPT